MIFGRRVSPTEVAEILLMRVFVTGATGFIGSAVVKELLAAGHQVLGLSRSDQGAQALAAAGAEVHRGSIGDLDSLKTGAARSDGVIHLAFNHDFSKFKANCEDDRRMANTIPGQLATEDAPTVNSAPGARYHAVAETGVRMRDIAETLGRRLNLPVNSISREEADAFFGWLAMFAAHDMPASSEQTQKSLGWHPTGPGMIADLEQLRVA
jgi:nucleoside-diphosphate-sugar epimerase